MANNNNIEKSATTSVEAILNDTGYVEPYINTGDKEPIWDGCIYVYNDKEKHNNDKNYQFRIPVQVKGTLAKIEKSLKYDMKTSHLKSYLKDGGVLYFVVQVDKNASQNNKIFYADLHPFNIKKILKNKSQQGKISVDITELPNDKEFIINFLYTFHVHLQKQKAYSILSENPFSLKLDTTQISIPVATPFSNIDPTRILLSMDNVCYVTLENGLEYPLNEVKKENFNQCSIIQNKVSSNNKDYFDCYKFIRAHNFNTLIFGDNIEFIFNDNGAHECKLSCKGTLSNYIKCMEFLLDVGKTNEFTIGNKNYNISYPSTVVPELENTLKKYQKLHHALELCQCTRELSIKDFTNTDAQNADLLIAAFEENEEISLNTTQEGCILNFTLCDFTIVCLAFRKKNGKYKFLPYPFNEDVDVGINGEKVKVSSYTMLKHQYIQNSLNINLDDCFDKIKQQTITQGALAQTNIFALELLLTYDNTKEQSFLDIAYKIMLWIEQNNIDKNSSVLYHLNTLQCIKRKNQHLSEEDNSYLYELTENSQDVFLKCGAAILLEEKGRAERLFNSLDDEQKIRIKNFPIYNLWKDLNNG